MIQKDFIDLVTKILLDAVENKTGVRIIMKNKGVELESYQDRIGTLQYLQLYMNNTDGYLIFSIKEKKDDSDSGKLSISWDKVEWLCLETESRGYTITINNMFQIIIFK